MAVKRSNNGAPEENTTPDVTVTPDPTPETPPEETKTPDTTPDAADTAQSAENSETKTETPPDVTVTPEETKTEDKSGVSVDPSALDTAPKVEVPHVVPNQNVTIRMRADHHCTIAMVRYDLKAGQKYLVPQNVKRILSDAGLLAPL